MSLPPVPEVVGSNKNSQNVITKFNNIPNLKPYEKASRRIQEKRGRAAGYKGGALPSASDGMERKDLKYIQQEVTFQMWWNCVQNVRLLTTL